MNLEGSLMERQTSRKTQAEELICGLPRSGMIRAFRASGSLLSAMLELNGVLASSVLCESGCRMNAAVPGFVESGFSVGKKPLKCLPSVYSNSGTAIVCK
jgi:hypothetical protein